LADGKLGPSYLTAALAAIQPPPVPTTERRKIGDSLINSVGVKLMYIPAGDFLMGGELEPAEVVKKFGGKVEFYQDERPQYRVKISKPFWLAAHGVTRGQFAQFVAETHYQTDAEKEGTGFAMSKEGYTAQKGINWRNVGFAQTDEHPVVQVSWNDAVAYCAWLSKKEGKSYHLPTEAQREYACRAGTLTIFPWGNEIDGGKKFANMADASAQNWMGQFNRHDDSLVPWDDGFANTAPVGSFAANAWGLYDMIGNALEWCHDW
jgi:formylglycine-generating enzyme required for sulfatase activity